MEPLICVMYFFIYLFPTVVAVGAIAGKVAAYRETRQRKSKAGGDAFDGNTK